MDNEFYKKKKFMIENRIKNENLLFKKIFELNQIKIGFL